MTAAIILALLASVYVAIYERQNSVPSYTVRNRTVFDDLIGNK